MSKLDFIVKRGNNQVDIIEETVYIDVIFDNSCNDLRFSLQGYYINELINIVLPNINTPNFEYKNPAYEYQYEKGLSYG